MPGASGPRLKVQTLRTLNPSTITALRGEGHRSIVVVGNYKVDPITAVSCRAKDRPLGPPSNLFRPRRSAPPARAWVEAPGTAPGSERLISTSIYRHSEPCGSQTEYRGRGARWEEGSTRESSSGSSARVRRIVPAGAKCTPSFRVRQESDGPSRPLQYMQLGGNPRTAGFRPPYGVERGAALDQLTPGAGAGCEADGGSGWPALHGESGRSSDEWNCRGVARVLQSGPLHPVATRLDRGADVRFRADCRGRRAAVRPGRVTTPTRPPASIPEAPIP